MPMSSLWVYKYCSTCKRPQDDYEVPDDSLQTVAVDGERDDTKATVIQAPRPDTTSSAPPVDTRGANLPSVEDIENDMDTTAQQASLNPEDETRMCPISGMNTLEGVCPFAKPKKKPKGHDPKLRMRMELTFETPYTKVTISVRPYLKEHFDTMELPDSASKDVVAKQYKKLALANHPDKNPDDPEAATERFQKIKAAYQAIKNLDGELAWSWDEYPERQKIVDGAEAIGLFGKLGVEACEQNPIMAVQLRHMVKTSCDTKILMHRKDDGSTLEIFVDALTLDERTKCRHIVRLYRKESALEESALEQAEPEAEDVAVISDA